MMYVILQVSWFAVFDGHAGSRVSAHCARHLLDCIVTSEDFKRAIKNEGSLSQDEVFSKVNSTLLIFRMLLALSTSLELKSKHSSTAETSLC